MRVKIEEPNSVLVVDDQLSRVEAMVRQGVIPPVLTHAPTATWGIRYMQEQKFDVVFLDHDLDTYVYEPYKREITGVDVVRAMIANQEIWKPAMTIIHSLNPEGAREMDRILKKAGYPCQRIPITAILES